MSTLCFSLSKFYSLQRLWTTEDNCCCLAPLESSFPFHYLCCTSVTFVTMMCFVVFCNDIEAMGLVVDSFMIVNKSCSLTLWLLLNLHLLPQIVYTFPKSSIRIWTCCCCFLSVRFNSFTERWALLVWTPWWHSNKQLNEITSLYPFNSATVGLSRVSLSALLNKAADLSVPEPAA